LHFALALVLRAIEGSRARRRNASVRDGRVVAVRRDIGRRSAVDVLIDGRVDERSDLHIRWRLAVDHAAPIEPGVVERDDALPAAQQSECDQG
jgi:hypothetical protein